jgi:hypothetical protein
MKNEIFVLKLYILDPSSYDIKDVSVTVFSSLENARAHLKKLMYDVYVENEGDEVSIEDWQLELYDNYEYEIYSDMIN